MSLDSLQKKFNKETLNIPMAMQCLLRDDISVVFRRLPIEHTCLVEKVNDVVRRAWKHFYKLQYPFNGYKRISAGMVTLAFERDIIYDPHGVLDKVEKPEKSGDLTRFKDVAKSRCRQIEANPGESLFIDKLTMALIFGFAGIILAIILRVAL